MILKKAFGLNVETEIDLPELKDGEGKEVEVKVRVSNLKDERKNYVAKGNRLNVSKKEVFLEYEGIGLMKIKNGREIEVHPFVDGEENLVRQLILGVGFGVLMHQRDKLVLHASAVKIDQEVIAFIGDKGQGKSTTAAAFLSAGYSVVTDDVLVIDSFSNGLPIVTPGTPQVKLYADSLSASLGDKKDKIEYNETHVDKKVYPLQRGIQSDKLPLKHIFSLEFGDRTKVHNLSKQKSFIKILSNTYLNKLLLDTNSLKWTTIKIARLINNAGVFSLEREKNINKLKTVVNKVIKTVKN